MHYIAYLNIVLGILNIDIFASIVYQIETFSPPPCVHYSVDLNVVLGILNIDIFASVVYEI